MLRRFELRLLAELGYALPLTREADTGAAIDPDGALPLRVRPRAARVAAHAPREPGARWPLVRGATLLALADATLPDAETAAEAKRLMREVLDHYLEQRGAS